MSLCSRCRPLLTIQKNAGLRFYFADTVQSIIYYFVTEFSDLSFVSTDLLLLIKITDKTMKLRPES